MFLSSMDSCECLSNLGARRKFKHDRLERKYQSSFHVFICEVELELLLLRVIIIIIVIIIILTRNNRVIIIIGKF